MTGKPARDDVSEGTFAIRIEDGKQKVWRAVRSDPYSSQVDWTDAKERTFDSLPKADFSGVEFGVDDDGRPLMYVEDIEAQEEVEPVQSQLSQNPSGEYALVIRGPDGHKHPFGSNMQADVFVDSIELLIEEYGLAEVLEMPYVPGYKNAIISDSLKHPDGREIERYREIANGHYVVSTAPTREKKAQYLIELCGMMDGVEIVFIRGLGTD